MILHPAIIALLVAAFLTAAMVVFSAFHAVRILRSWDIASGSERQLRLERETYLVSSLLGFAFAFQLISLPLLVYVADTLHMQIAGAMCAVGTFNANTYGYPALVLKIVNFFLAGLWLTVNRADNRGYDYPLIRSKYRLLLALTLPIVLEALLLGAFFLNLRGDVITSCCGSLFSAGGQTVSSELAALPALPTAAAFYLSAGLCMFLGLRFGLRPSAGYALGAAAAVTFIAAIAAVISFFGPLFYELPHHHCPFCILQAEYHHVGYVLYAALFGGTAAGLGCAVLAPFRAIPSLKRAVPRMQKRLALGCLLLYGGFVAIVTLRMMLSDFRVVS